MCELSALWTFIPVWLLAYADPAQAGLNVSPWSFLIIAAGFLITTFSIQTINFMLPLLGPQTIILLLLPGPVFGLWALRTLLRPNCGTAARIPRR